MKVAKKTATNLQKMTYDYFYPDLCSGNKTFEVPSLEALLLIGTNNLYDIGKALDHAAQTLKAMISTINDEYAAAQNVFRYGKMNHCDWHGAGHGKVLAVSKHEMMEKDVRAYEKQRKLLQGEIFVCSFGRQLAKWCNDGPRDRAYLAYQKCLDGQPFYNEPCKLCADRALFKAGLEHLQSMIKEYEARLGFIRRYKQAIGQAYDRTIAKRPMFNITPSVYLAELLVGARVVGIYRYHQRCVVKRGLFLGIALDSFGVPAAHIRLKSGKLVTVRLVDDVQEDALYLSEIDYQYLRSDPEFREVWHTVTKKFCSNEMTEMINLMLRRADFG